MKLVYIGEHAVNTTIFPEAPVVVKFGTLDMDDLRGILALRGGAKIEAYEPNPVAFEKQLPEAEAIGVKLINKALGYESTVRLYLYTNPQSNSIYPRHKTSGACVLVDSVLVDAVTLAGAIKEKTHLLILNCEGVEIDALKEIMANKKLSGMIDQICVSWHEGKIYQKAVKESVTRNMAKTHHVITVPPKHRGHKPDTLFIRR